MRGVRAITSSHSIIVLTSAILRGGNAVVILIVNSIVNFLFTLILNVHLQSNNAAYV